MVKTCGFPVKSHEITIFQHQPWKILTGNPNLFDGKNPWVFRLRFSQQTNPATDSPSTPSPHPHNSPTSLEVPRMVDHQRRRIGSHWRLQELLGETALSESPANPKVNIEKDVQKAMESEWF